MKIHVQNDTQLTKRESTSRMSLNQFDDYKRNAWRSKADVLAVGGFRGRKWVARGIPQSLKIEAHQWSPPLREEAMGPVSPCMLNDIIGATLQSWTDGTVCRPWSEWTRMTKEKERPKWTRITKGIVMDQNGQFFWQLECSSAAKLARTRAYHWDDSMKPIWW